MIKLLLIKGVFTKDGNTAKVICQQGRADGLACLDLSVNVSIQVLVSLIHIDFVVWSIYVTFWLLVWNQIRTTQKITNDWTTVNVHYERQTYQWAIFIGSLVEKRPCIIGWTKLADKCASDRSFNVQSWIDGILFRIYFK
jgi:hypothetical protein